ncbi:MAG: tannase [Lachnospiraceae bacterium]|nr:tannase [Lachnospiraceae bacterium]
MKRKIVSLIISGMLIFSLSACEQININVVSAEDPISENKVDEEESDQGEEEEILTGLSEVDNSLWQYNSEDNVYYQIGVSYCEYPADESYETLSIFVPGDYMRATDNGDGTYTCEIDKEKEIGSYTAETAPIVMPINTPGYSAQSALTEYKSVSDYTDRGFVYVHAGCRGRDEGAPAGVTDLKAAVKYIRYSDDAVPGDAESIFTFGMSGGGAQSAVMGSSGDSDLYEPYLDVIGAVKGVSDAVLGSMCWCPITNLDTADEAYEWMLGSTRSGLSEEEQAISDELAKAYAEYINEAGIKDGEGNILTLEESEEGIYQAGSYYDYMKSEIERSLNNFLEDTEFPYDASSENSQGGPGGGQGGPGGGQGGPGGEKPEGEMPAREKPEGEMPGNSQGDPMEDLPEGEMPDTETTAASSTDEEQSYEEIDDITRNETTSGVNLSGTYEKAKDYIDALNENGEWVTYDEASNTATISDIEAFVKAFKSASKNLGAFDQLDAGQGENTLFGYGDGSGAHFDKTLAKILEELNSEYASDYTEDLIRKDARENTVETRLNMYTPLYYLLETSKGYDTSKVAKYWRIRTGIAQGDCSLSTEMNLALALSNYSDDASVDFETVWGKGHTQAERSGNAAENFIEWVDQCMAE